MMIVVDAEAVTIMVVSGSGGWALEGAKAFMVAMTAVKVVLLRIVREPMERWWTSTQLALYI